MSKVEWKNDGWVVVQEPDEKLHLLEVSILVKDGSVTELRMRHNDGEEEKFTGKICEGYTLPISLADFKAAWKSKKIKLK